MTHAEALETLHTCLTMIGIGFAIIGVIMYKDLRK